MANEPNWQDSPPPQEWQDTSPPPARKRPSVPPATIGPQPSRVSQVLGSAFTPTSTEMGIGAVHPLDALSKATEGIENYTPQGRTEHPILSRLGDVTRSTKQWLGIAVPTALALSGPLAGEDAIGAASDFKNAVLPSGGIRRAIGASKAFESVPTRALGEVIESPSKGPAYAFRKLFPEPPEAANARGPLQSSLEQRMTDVQNSRQKELADIEKLKEQDARSRMVRGAQQNRIDTANAKRLQSAEEGRQQQLSDMAKLESQHGQEQADVIERQQREPDAVTSAVRQGIASRVPTRMPPTVPPPKPLVSLGGERASEPTFSGSEGRAATWTNEDVMRLARQGNREAISQAIRRGMELPAGARYVMGDADPGRAVYNPREVTRFSPEGTPIRNMENPTVPKSSRNRIATSETLEAKPLPFTGPPRGDIPSQIQPRPFTIANAMGIRWAKTPGLPDISIPNGMAEEDIPAYVAEKQALQSKGVTSILGNK